jgi:hypothetical protein
MFNSTVLDVAIGMAFVYLLLSLLCSAAAEVIAGALSLRAKNLEAGIRSLFSDGFGPSGDAFVRGIYEHGLIRGLYRDRAVDLVPAQHAALTNLYDKPIDKAAGRKLPSYIPARTFASALLDILASGNASSNPDNANPPDAAAGNAPQANSSSVMASIKDTIDSLPSSNAKQALQSLLLGSNNEFAKLQRNFEDWYNDAMDRAAGWYKRQSQKILLGLGLVTAVLVNANSITLARVLWVDPGIREATVTSATAYLKANPATTTTDAAATLACASAAANPTDPVKTKKCGDQTAADLNLLRKKISMLSDAESTTLLPIGWKDPIWEGPIFTRPEHGEHIKLLIITLTGWLLTAIALSLGAPFWFDLLNKFMVVRSTIKPQEKSQAEKSKG